MRIADLPEPLIDGIRFSLFVNLKTDNTLGTSEQRADAAAQHLHQQSKMRKVFKLTRSE